MNSLYPFCLLTTNALELFLKVIIATDICIQINSQKKEINDSIKQVVIEKLKTYRHDIKKMIDESGIKEECKITKVKKYSNNFVNDYQLYFDDGNLLCFKDSESIRFGSLAKKQDIAVSSSLHFNKEAVDF